MKRTSLVLALAFALVISWFATSSFAATAPDATQPTADATTSMAPATPVVVSSEACGAASLEVESLSVAGDGHRVEAAFDPPGWPPTSCVCGGCCENNRCWRNGSIAKCLSY